MTSRVCSSGPCPGESGYKLLLMCLQLLLGTWCPQSAALVEDLKSGGKPTGADWMVSFWSPSYLIASMYLTVLAPLFTFLKLSPAVALLTGVPLDFSSFLSFCSFLFWGRASFQCLHTFPFLLCCLNVLAWRSLLLANVMMVPGQRWVVSGPWAV